MKHKRKVFVVAGFLVVIATGFAIKEVLLAQKTLSIPVPYISMPASEVTTEYEISNTMEFPDENKAVLYQMQVDEPEEIRAQISSAIGVEIKPEDLSGTDIEINEQFYYLEDASLTVTINEETGFWASLVSDGGRPEIAVVPKNLPTDDEAVQIAKDYISTNKLFDGDLGEPTIAYSTAGSELEGNEQLLAKRIVFTPPIDGVPVYGLYRIVITVWDHGEVTDVYMQANPVEEFATVKLKSKKEVLEEVLEHPEQISSSSVDIPVGKITDCDLAYYVDGMSADGSAYAYPVYVLTGEGETVQDKLSRTAKVETKEFDIVIDAIKR